MSISEAYRYLKILGPEVPGILKSGLWHTFGLSPESSKWDARTNLVVTSIRALLSKSSTPITRQQIVSGRDPGVRGAQWAAPVTLSVHDDDNIDQLLFNAIADMKTGPNEQYTRPPLVPVEAEWQGYRAGVASNAVHPTDLPAKELYSKLMADVKSPATICYFHGGAYYLMDPATHRPISEKLCKISGARVLSIRYRLAPAHPFPAAILDCFIGYLSLLYPGDKALHQPVKPEDVVLAGDSAGANACLAVLALLLQIQQTTEKTGPRTMKFNGQDIELPIPLPGGVAMSSPWTDMTRSMPSLVDNYHYDYIPLPAMSMTATPAAAAPTAGGAEAAYQFSTSKVSTREHNPGENRNPFPCDLWPEVPPRADLYVDGTLFCHPLASPLALPAEFWKGSPPVFMESGEEMLSDELNIVARRMHQAGVKVRWVCFEAMPHCFTQMFSQAGCAPATVSKGYEMWGGWIDTLINGGRIGQKGVALEGATFFSAPDLKEKTVDIATLSSHVSDGECAARMREEARRRQEAWEKLVSGTQAKL